MKRLLFIVITYLLFLSPTFAQQWLWGKNGIGTAEVWAMEADNYGNCYLAGTLPPDTLYFGSYTLMNSNSIHIPYYDGYLVKYNSKGQLQWARQTISHDTSSKHSDFSPYTSAVDYEGNPYLAVNYTDTLIIGTYTLVSNNGNGSTCLIKYDSNGNVKWVNTSRNSSHTDTDLAIDNWVSCDKFGNTFLLGAGVYDTIYFGSQKVYYYHNVYFNDFLVKYDSNGNVKWARQLVPHSESSAGFSEGSANDDLGNTFITGAFYDTVQYGSFILSNTKHDDFEVVKYDSAGNVLWAKQSVTPSSSSRANGWNVTTDKHGNAYICGGFSDTVVFGQDTIKDTLFNRANFFVVKYSPSGNVLWVKQATILDSNGWTASSISSDDRNNIYLSANGGYKKCKVAFGRDTLSLDDTAKHDGASLYFKLDSNGKALCGAILPGGTQGGGFYTGITADTSGKHVYVGGFTGTILIFGQDTVNPYSVPTDPNAGLNVFPFIARWEACDSDIFEAVPEEQKPLSNVLVYPNPNNGNFIIALQNINEPTRVEVYNVMGQQVQSGKLNLNKTSIDMSNEASGIYFYRVLNENGESIGSGKVVIER